MTKLFPIEQILTILAANPSRIAEATNGLTPVQQRTSPAQDEWSVNHVLAHLRACSDVWGGHILKILNEDSPTLIGVNPRTWMKKTNYLELDFPHSFQAFSGQRAELLAVLEKIQPEDWNRTAKVQAWGQIYAQTVHRYADGLARHERSHVRQIEQTAAAVRKVV